VPSILDDLLDAEVQVIFAADQEPFEVEYNRFCVAMPLITADGRRLDSPQLFPHRGRAWWMLRPDIPWAAIRPGMIWSGTLEPAIKADKDRYQIRRQSAVPGAREWVEVIDLDADDPDVAEVLADRGLPFDRQPLARVVVRGRKSALGPFKAAFDPVQNRVRLSALNLAKPVAWRIATADLKGVEEFRFEANRNQFHAPARRMQINLVHERGLAALESAGEAVDAASDAQVVKWALGLANYTGRRRTEFREALDELNALPQATTDRAAIEFPGRLERFRAICESGERLLALGPDVAELAAQSPGMRGLVEKHIEQLTEQEVQRRVAARQQEIERQVADAERQRRLLDEEIARLQADFDQKKTEQEQALAREHEAWIQRLATIEKQLAEREAAVAQQEGALESRLERVIASYREHAQELGDQLVAQLPLLRRLGLGTSAPAPAPETPAPTAGTLALPAFLEHAVPDRKVDEQDFLDQFQRVVAARGFVYARDDLVNFHVSIKVGTWTVLAGPTGIGKSSLPDLYAEALGMREEALTIPVRPDWLDDRDVLGAFNAIAGRFEPAPTGLVDRLIAAQEDLARGRGGIYVVCLDEMNLARVEHYFAQFLSVLEKPAERRAIELMARGVASPSDPYARHRTLRIGENVRFVGTVNIDETTHFFSPKVLDRAALLILEAPDLEREPPTPARAHELAIEPVPLSAFKSWVHGPERAPAAARALVLAADTELRKIRSGLGYRLRNRVLAHVASAEGLLPAERALDLAFAQGVLPRIRTHEPGARNVLEALLGLLPEPRYPRSARLLRALCDADGEASFFQLL